MVGNRYIAGLAVTYVSKKTRLWGGTWGHIEGEFVGRFFIASPEHSA